MKRITLSGMLAAFTALVVGCGASLSGNDAALRFSPDQVELRVLTLPDGKTVNYSAHEHIYYVTNVEDSTYQYLNFYVPEGADQTTPIILRTYVGGYRASEAKEPTGFDATGHSLARGYVLCIAGSRGANSKVGDTYTGRVPNGLLDLKAAVRYLKLNDDLMAGDANKIFSHGTSAGGAMSSLLGATGNAACYEPYLEAMGAASTGDDVFASVCYCPITDLDHADMAYEWLYNCTNDGVRALSEERKNVSEQLAAAFPAYIDSLGLKDQDGNDLTGDNFLDYIKGFIVASAQKGIDDGCELPEGAGIIRAERVSPFRRSFTDFVIDVDMPAYLSYVAGTARLKNPPAFDAMGVISDRSSAENEVFGHADGTSANFTEFSAACSGGSIDEDMARRVRMMNPLNFIGTGESDVAPHWYIRHGARDRDTSFPVPVILATKLMNCGYDVDFFLPWNRPHAGDYNLPELFEWMESVLAE